MLEPADRNKDESFNVILKLYAKAVNMKLD